MISCSIRLSRTIDLTIISSRIRSDHILGLLTGSNAAHHIHAKQPKQLSLSRHYIIQSTLILLRTFALGYQLDFKIYLATSFTHSSWESTNITKYSSLLFISPLVLPPLRGPASILSIKSGAHMGIESRSTSLCRSPLYASIQANEHVIACPCPIYRLTRSLAPFPSSLADSLQVLKWLAILYLA